MSTLIGLAHELVFNAVRVSADIFRQSVGNEMLGDSERQSVWFWQRIITPHMASLAEALAVQGYEVNYIAERAMSDERKRQGWVAPELQGVALRLAPGKADMLSLVSRAPAESIHICQGIRGNGLVGEAQQALAMRALRQWIVMETIDDNGWRGFLKRLEYRRLFARWHDHVEGVLAIGNRTPDWLVARGVPKEKIFPFAYFLSDRLLGKYTVQERTGPFRFVSVGQFTPVKCLDHLIAALAALPYEDIELAVVGSGPLEVPLREAAEAALPGRVRWIGRLSMDEVPRIMAQSDCLVLPSSNDGWGAVVSESLMQGTPVICSDACGSSVVVKQNQHSEVFAAGDIPSLTDCLDRMIKKGRITKKNRLDIARWASCLGGKAGAEYLVSILDHVDGKGQRPSPPWEQ